ncbi:MAG: fumarylacetoacetate hydrolase family protein [Rhodocyclaceae bacterium]|nr:fumarylacetoacetate hydrolase family protein [Rhodocyclaceae bacterium]
MLPDPQLDQIATEMSAARRNARPIACFTPRHPGFDLAGAYAVAARLHAEHVAAGAIPVGRKIGFTNSALWEVYGVGHPIWAYVYDDTVSRPRGRPAHCSLEGLVQPKIEPEIVLHFHRAPPPGADVAAIADCIDWCTQGFEIVQSHFPDWRFSPADAVADNSLHGYLVLGQTVPLASLGDDPVGALERFGVDLFCDGKLCASGRGANALGNPLAALAHLVALLDSQSPAVALKAGEIVTTGTLTAALDIQPRQTWHTELSGIGLEGLAVRFD